MVIFNITENLINGKKYIGKHESSSFDSTYKGSGAAIKDAFLKYGWDNFSCKVLCECSSIEELNEKEKHFIDLYDAVTSPDFYNIAEGGSGGDTVKGLSEFQKLDRANKISLHNTGKKVMHKGDHQTRVSPDKIEEYLANGYTLGVKYKGRPLSEKHKKSISDGLKGHPGAWAGKKRPPEIVAKVADKNRGRKHSDEVKQRISAAKKGKHPSEETLQKLRAAAAGKPKSDEHKKKIGLAHKGRKKETEHKKKISETLKNQRWVNDGIKNLKISRDDLDIYLSKGYIRGKVKVNKELKISE